jgi:predicted nuclease of predicted toxin-antitoxin system
MQFLADESCDSILVKILQEAGQEVLNVAEITPRAEDSEIIRLANGSKRIRLTEDKDFGQLVFAHGEKKLGVIFLRFPFSARNKIARDVSSLIDQQGEKLFGCFIAIQPGRIRISRIPRRT